MDWPTDVLLRATLLRARMGSYYWPLDPAEANVAVWLCDGMFTGMFRYASVWYW
jgi:hypothetical protein